MTAPNPDTPAVETTALRKIYPGVDGPPKEALKSVNLSVPPGSVFGLLGPNGAGKSTLINILAGLVVKTSGSARILGWDIEKDMRQARTAIGIVPQELNLDAFFSPREVMELQAGFYGVPKRERRTMEILTALGLDDKADVYARSMSGGMRRRLLVAKALVHSPPVVILDEPTAGVDVELRQSLWDYMKELNDAGPPRELLIRFPPSQVHMGTLLDAVKRAGLEIADLSTRDTDLEEIFVALTSNRGDGLPPRRSGDPQAGTLEKTRSRPDP